MKITRLEYHYSWKHADTLNEFQGETQSDKVIGFGAQRAAFTTPHSDRDSVTLIAEKLKHNSAGEFVEGAALLLRNCGTGQSQVVHCVKTLCISCSARTKACYSITSEYAGEFAELLEVFGKSFWEN